MALVYERWPLAIKRLRCYRVPHNAQRNHVSECSTYVLQNRKSVRRTTYRLSVARRYEKLGPLKSRTRISSQNEVSGGRRSEYRTYRKRKQATDVPSFIDVLRPEALSLRSRWPKLVRAVRTTPTLAASVLKARSGARLIRDTAGIVSPRTHHTGVRSNRHREFEPKFTTPHNGESRYQ